MSHDVFVSYPSADKATADAVVSTLESHRLRCWYAPRDVMPGVDWAGSIVQAIGVSRLMVLVFSEAANASEHILREVRQAADARIPIVPFRISPEPPSDSLEYYIGGTHWLDALTRPLEDHLEQLVETAQRILGDAASGPAWSEPVPKEPPAVTTPTARRRSASIWGRLRSRPRFTLGIAVAAVALTVAGVLVIISLGGETTQPAAVAPTESSTSTPEDTAPAETSSTSTSADTARTQASSIPEGAGDRRALSFLISDPQLWEVSGDDRFTALVQDSADAFAWSTDAIEGDLTVSLDIESPGGEASGCVIIYGGGHRHSYGSLIFCVEWDVFSLEKHTTYHSGENFVAFSPSNIGFGEEVYAVTIDIEGDVATMFVNDQKVISTVLDPEEIAGRGRIGLHKKWWISPEVTFSNIEVSTPVDGEQASAIPEDDGFECELDTGSQAAQADYYPIASPFISHAVDIDGSITSPAEWSDAPCVDLRMHYSINVTNPDFRSARLWVQNNGQDIFFLVRAPRELGILGTFANYFWPEYVGTWAHTDGVYVERDGTVHDQGLWDELQFRQDVDLEPPGTVDAIVAASEDADYYWLEIKRPLNSGDDYDWAFEPGQTYGHNPYDNFMIGFELDEGMFLRYLKLELGG